MVVTAQLGDHQPRWHPGSCWSLSEGDVGARVHDGLDILTDIRSIDNKRRHTFTLRGMRG
jgi:hypothetical protein